MLSFRVFGELGPQGSGSVLYMSYIQWMHTYTILRASIGMPINRCLYMLCSLSRFSRLRLQIKEDFTSLGQIRHRGLRSYFPVHKHLVMQMIHQLLLSFLHPIYPIPEACTHRSEHRISFHCCELITVRGYGDTAAGQQPTMTQPELDIASEDSR